MPLPRDVRPQSSHLYSLELDDFQLAGSKQRSDPSAIDESPSALLEEEPLLRRDPDNPTPSPSKRSLRDLDQRSGASNSHTSSRQHYQTSRSSNHIAAIMEKIRESKVARIANKLAVTSEPGLTNAQLMLTNFDLKPGLCRQRDNLQI